MDTNLKKNKDRSPNFPFINLENALERAYRLYQEEKKGSVPFAVAVKHWGYSLNSSGASQTVAALKNYGLINDEGSGTHRRIRLSELALRIILDNRPDSPDIGLFKRQAALSPSLTSEIYDKWPDSLPSEHNLHHFLVLDKKFNPDTARKVCKIIKENEIFTKDSIADILSSNEKEEKDIEMQETNQTQAEAKIASSNIQNFSRTERIIDPEGLDIVLQFSGEPTSESYEFLRDYIDLRLKRMKRQES
jgi:hypothetical protein